jgi:hypothetical protein
MEDRDELRFSISNHINALSPSLFFAVIFFSVIVWQKFDRTAIIIFSIGYLVDLIPALFLHAEYWAQNRGQVVFIDTNEMMVKEGTKERVIKAHEIRKITLHQTPSHSQNSGMRFFTIGSYYFAHIRLKNGEDLILTSLLSPRLKALLKKLKGVYFDEDVSLYNNLYRALD